MRRSRTKELRGKVTSPLPRKKAGRDQLGEERKSFFSLPPLILSDGGGIIIDF